MRMKFFSFLKTPLNNVKIREELYEIKENLNKKERK
jgi:hypothetical protein